MGVSNLQTSVGILERSYTNLPVDHYTNLVVVCYTSLVVDHHTILVVESYTSLVIECYTILVVDHYTILVVESYTSGDFSSIFGIRYIDNGRKWVVDKKLRDVICCLFYYHSKNPWILYQYGQL